MPAYAMGLNSYVFSRLFKTAMGEARAGFYEDYFKPLNIYILYFNKLKKRAKQYDMIFVDNQHLNHLLSAVTSRVYQLNLENDKDKIYEMVDAMSKVKYEM